MHEFDIAILGAAKLDEETKLPVYQASVQLTTEDDLEDFGDIDSFQCLGVTSLPFEPTEDGAAEGVVLRDVGNQDGIIVGARDVRCAEVYGDMANGDTVLHSVEPDAVSQVQCKADGSIALVINKDKDGDTFVLSMDGPNQKFAISAFGGWIEMSKDNGIVITTPDNNSSIQMKDGAIMLVGKVILGGTTAIQNLAAWISVGGIPSVPGVTPFNPAPNVFVGAV